MPPLLSVLKHFSPRKADVHAPSEEAWAQLWPALPLLQGLSDDDAERLRLKVGLVLSAKDIQGAAGQEVDDLQRLWIAVPAALMLLNLDMGWFHGWASIILYPGKFVSRHEYEDGDGVVHDNRRPLVGEARYDGPVVLSWEEVQQDMRGDEPGHVVIHELAHKLDMLNGDTNGFPPLPRNMDRGYWTEVFSEAYRDHCHKVRWDEELIDAYAASKPGEFFAVSCETFFTDPHTLREAYPQVYQQLRELFQQNPVARLPRRTTELDAL